MAQHWDRTTEHGAMVRALWPEPDEIPHTAQPGDATFLRMYPPGRQPRPGSLRSDHLEMDSHWHFHDMHQLFCTFEGAIEIEAEVGRHLISRQLAAWIPAQVAHRASLHCTPSVSVFFTGDMVPDEGNRIRSLVVTPLMREMLREATRWPLHDAEDPVRQAFFAAMAALCSEWIEDQETQLFLPACTDARLKRALDFTAERSDAKLAEVCAIAGMSERSLRRHLRAETGLTWEAWRQRSRLLQAISMLGETEAPIIEVAAACGFESPSAFAKAFRAALGEAPSDYRRRISTGQGDGPSTPALPGLDR
jgi:AraC-like DNA-binding protein